MNKSGAATMDEYIEQFPPAVRGKLAALRALISRLAPEAQEKISYRMPCFYLNGNLVYFAAHAKHIGFYPTPSGINAFRKELAGYECSKGAVQFALDKALPTGLITKIVKFRRSENLAKGGAGAAAKTGAKAGK